MEVVKMKYENFQKFCYDTLPKNSFVELLQNTLLGLFLQTIKSHQGEMSNEDEIMDKIFQKAGIKYEDFKPEDLIKFKRYITYFNEVVQCLD